jgi:hypothetical protein
MNHRAQVNHLVDRYAKEYFARGGYLDYDTERPEYKRLSNFLWDLPVDPREINDQYGPGQKRMEIDEGYDENHGVSLNEFWAEIANYANELGVAPPPRPKLGGGNRLKAVRGARRLRRY